MIRIHTQTVRGRRPTIVGEYPDGFDIGATNPPLPHGTPGAFDVHYDIGDRWENYPAGTVFNEPPVAPVVPPPAQNNNAQGQQDGRVNVNVGVNGTPRFTTTTLEASILKYTLAGVLLVLAVFVTMRFMGGNTPPQVVTVTKPPVVAPAPVVTLPKCSDEITRCKALADKLGEDSQPCEKIDEDCSK